MADGDGLSPAQLRSLDRLRGLAMLLVVTGHCFVVAGVRVDSLPERILGNLLVGGTFLFVFLSGFLFHHRTLDRFHYRRFLASKTLRLLVPYLVLSAIPIHRAVAAPDGAWDGFFLPTSSDLLGTWVIPVAKYLATGRALIAYWFVPYAILNLFCAPVHAWFARSREPVRMAVFLISLVVAMAIRKPVGDIGPLQHLFYFLPAYLAGILASIHRDRLLAALSGKVLLPMLGAFALAVAQGLQLPGDRFGNYHGHPFQAGPLDLMLPQKLLMCLALLSILDRRGPPGGEILETLARRSLPIYFLHPPILLALEALGLPFASLRGWVALPLVVVAVVGSCLAISGFARSLPWKWAGRLVGA